MLDKFGAPCQSVVCLFFCSSRKRFFLIFLQAQKIQKNWQIRHPLDPLADFFSCSRRAKIQINSYDVLITLQKWRLEKGNFIQIFKRGDGGLRRIKHAKPALKLTMSLTTLIRCCWGGICHTGHGDGGMPTRHAKAIAMSMAYSLYLQCSEGGDDPKWKVDAVAVSEQRFWQSYMLQHVRCVAKMFMQCQLCKNHVCFKSGK